MQSPLTKILFATLLSLAFFSPGYAQTLDKARLDRFFDRLGEKNKAMRSLVIAKDGKALYARAIGYSQINGAEKKPLTTTLGAMFGLMTPQPAITSLMAAESSLTEIRPFNK